MPSATSAIEPNSRPPTISAIIMAPHSQITAQVLRSLFSCPSPRKTWLCKFAVALSLIGASLQIGTDDSQKPFRRVDIQRFGMFLRVDEVGAHMILDDFGHQAGGSAAHGG